MFENKKIYDDFIDKKGKKIFKESIGNCEFNRYIYEMLNNLIEGVFSYYEEKSFFNYMIIIDQYKSKYDIYHLNSTLEYYTKKSETFKFICCSSTNECDERDSIYSSLFDKRNNNTLKYIGIDKIIENNSVDLSEKKKKIAGFFGDIPCNENKEDLKVLVENLEKEIFLEIKNSIKNLNITNKVVNGISLVLMNIDKQIEKKSLKTCLNI